MHAQLILRDCQFTTVTAYTRNDALTASTFRTKMTILGCRQIYSGLPNHIKDIKD